jgi:hypothetical protein
VLDGQVRQISLHVVGIDSSGGIAGRIRNQHARPRCDLGRDLVRIGLKCGARRERERQRHGAKTTADRGIGGKSGIGIKHFVTGLKQGHHRLKQRDLAPRRHDDVVG